MTNWALAQRAAREFFIALAIAFGFFHRRRAGWHTQQLAAACQFLFAVAVAEEAVVADTLETIGEYVHQEAADAEIRMDETQDLIEHMRETMHDAPGVGLAAPQIGLPIQLAVIEDREEYLKGVSPELLAGHERQAVPFLTLINPRIVGQSEDEVKFFEGCLSLAGYSALVKRSRSVEVEYLDASGKTQRLAAQGWFARILQHEIDHLQGTMYIDRMEPRSLTTVENLSRYWRALPIARVREVLGLG